MVAAIIYLWLHWLNVFWTISLTAFGIVELASKRTWSTWADWFRD
jgi:hypothetical protein